MLPDMNPYFLAYGPEIKEGHKVKSFSTTDLYSLFCDILNIRPMPNNGSHANIRDILKHPNNSANKSHSHYILLISTISFLSTFVFR